MHKPKHTPGPWAIASYDDEGDLAITNKDSTIALLDQRCFDDGLIDLKENESNAHLIAAAPDMLEALSGLLNAFRTCIGNEAFQDFALGNNAVIAAHNAIAKATGGTNE